MSGNHKLFLYPHLQSLEIREIPKIAKILHLQQLTTQSWTKAKTFSRLASVCLEAGIQTLEPEISKPRAISETLFAIVHLTVLTETRTH